jgi:hypothetical protein
MTSSTALTNQNTTFSLSDLPWDVVGYICNDLPTRAVLNFRQTSTKIYGLISNLYVGTHVATNLPKDPTLDPWEWGNRNATRLFEKLYPLSEYIDEQNSRVDGYVPKFSLAVWQNRFFTNPQTYRSEMAQGFLSSDLCMAQIKHAMGRSCNVIRLISEATYIKKFFVGNLRMFPIGADVQLPHFPPVYPLWNIKRMTNHLTQLTSLQELEFEGQDPSETQIMLLPKENFQFMSQMTSLTRLVLKRHDLAETNAAIYAIDFSFLTRLTALTHLNVTCKFSQEHPLAFCTNSTCLTNLRVEYREAGRGLVHSNLFAKFVHLKRLNLCKIDFSDVTLQSFKSLTALTDLHLVSRVFVHYFAPTLGTLQQLQNLGLTDCFLMEKSAPFNQALRSLTNLTDLFLNIQHPHGVNEKDLLWEGLTEGKFHNLAFPAFFFQSQEQVPLFELRALKAELEKRAAQEEATE